MHELTISNKHQGRLRFGLAILDLNREGTLALLSEVVPYHLNDASGGIMAHLGFLQVKKTEKKGNLPVFFFYLILFYFILSSQIE